MQWAVALYRWLGGRLSLFCMFTETFVRVKRANSHRLFAQARRFCKMEAAKNSMFYAWFEIEKLWRTIEESLLEPTRIENRSSGGRKFSVNVQILTQCAEVAHVTQSRHGDTA